MKTSPPHAGWLEIVIDVDPVAHDALGAFLFDLGCEGIISAEKSQSTLKAYLHFDKDSEEIRKDLDLFLQGLGDFFAGAESYGLKLNRIENRDWGLLWRDFFKKEQITGRLTVIPAWDPVPPPTEGHIIRMDPGPAFGTGQHESTRMCIRAMEAAVPSTGWTMMDVGTGSGILAIYGAKLGARRVSAIDIDPEALRWAKRNIELNDLPVGIELSSRPLLYWDESFTLITANLVLHTILELSPYFPPVLQPGGRLILSGILREQVRKVQERLSAHGLVHEQSLYENEWACTVHRKTGPGDMNGDGSSGIEEED